MPSQCAMSYSPLLIFCIYIIFRVPIIHTLYSYETLPYLCTDTQGEEEGENHMRGLRKGDGVGVARLTPQDATRQRTGEEMGMGGRVHGGEGRGRDTNIQAGVPQGGDNGVPSGRVPGEGRDTDGDARALLEEARAGHHHHLGGGKPTPSKVRKLQQVCTVAGPQCPP